MAQHLRDYGDSALNSQMPRRVLGRSENAQYEDSVPILPIINHMALVFVATQAGADLAYVASKFRVLCKDQKAAFQIGHVTARAFGSEIGDGIAGDGLHIEKGVTG